MLDMSLEASSRIKTRWIHQRDSVTEFDTLCSSSAWYNSRMSRWGIVSCDDTRAASHSPNSKRWRRPQWVTRRKSDAEDDNGKRMTLSTSPVYNGALLTHTHRAFGCFTWQKFGVSLHLIVKLRSSSKDLYSWNIKTTKAQNLAGYQVKNIATMAKDRLIQIVSLCAL